MGLTVAIGGYALLFNSSRVRAPIGILVATVAIYGIYLYHAASQPTNAELVARVFIFIPASFILIFVIPYMINEEDFLRIVSLVAGTAAIVGTPAAIVGDSLPIISVHTTTTVLGVEFYIIQSVLSNPNPLGELLFFGGIASLVWTKRSAVRRISFSVCIIGLFLTQSRAAFLGFAAAITVYVVGSAVDRRHFHQFILLSLAFGMTGYLMLLRLIPGPAVIEQVYLAGRLDIWYAAIDAVKARPLFGHGPGDMPTIVGAFASGSVGAGVYNSFLRLFVTTGVIGGLCYVYIFLYSITAHAKVIASREPLLIHALVIGFVVNELFSGNSIFGLSTTSVVGALLIGFMLRDIVDDGSKTLQERS
ncbi:O-antigen ligase family protein [Natrialbaceae archaeon A-gly3]